MHLSKEILREIISINDGDMRKIINFLQRLKLEKRDRIADVDSLYQIVGLISPIMIKEVLHILLNDDYLTGYQKLQ